MFMLDALTWVTGMFSGGLRLRSRNVARVAFNAALRGVQKGSGMDRRAFVVGSALCAGAVASTTPGSLRAATPKANPQNAAPQCLTWDAGSGPDRALWSQKLNLHWAHPGVGDWLDARQQAQGPQSYASGNAAVGLLDLNVTALVQRWLRNGDSRGFYLCSAENFPITFGGRKQALASE
jgi:hypothetical protein